MQFKKKNKYVKLNTNMRENEIFARLQCSMRKQRMENQNHDKIQLG